MTFYVLCVLYGVRARRHESAWSVCFNRLIMRIARRDLNDSLGGGCSSGPGDATDTDSGAVAAATDIRTRVDNTKDEE